MRSRRAGAAMIAAAGLTLAAGCSEPESYIVLSLRTSTPTAIDNVARIQVMVWGGCDPGTEGCACNANDICSGGLTCMLHGCVSSPGMGATVAKKRTLVYEAHGMAINQTEKKTLSVGFSHGEIGNVVFWVDALNSLGCSLGSGTVKQEIKKGGAVEAIVSLAAGAVCNNVDGGAPEVPEGTTLPGCDPVNPQSADAGTLCNATQTCQVCTPPDGGVSENECVLAGAGGPGATCKTNKDCMPGTQCFTYMCDVGLCLRFCNGNAECAPVGQGGGGPGSVCEGPVMCPTFLTAYHTCTFNCDPRAMAASNRGGCPMGLGCVMPASMDKVDCACLESTRTKLEGQPCTQAADCAPGLICNQMSGTKVCRPICRCDANASGNCMATANDCPTAGTTCHAVTNDTIYGVCL